VEDIINLSFVHTSSSPNSEFDLTSEFSEVLTPRKNSPRETELRIFSEWGKIWESRENRLAI